jgi:hypothetical protein
MNEKNTETTINITTETTPSSDEKEIDVEQSIVINDISWPPTTFKKRNQHGLLNGVKYIFDENGMINWRKMIPVEYLYINSESKRRDSIEKRYGKKIEEIDIIKDNVRDEDLVQLLAATKYLLRLRGYNYISFHLKEAKEDYVAVSCNIDFIGNYETDGREVTYSDSACAHYNNTKGFGRQYLVEIATNRALARTVRNFLNINIVSKEELGIAEETAQTNGNNLSPISILKQKMEERKISFDKLVESAKKKNVEGSETWKKLEDISPRHIFTILSLMAEKEEKQKK